jgi:flagellar hook-length control protein FliK
MQGDFATLLLATTDGSAVAAPSMNATAAPLEEKSADVARGDAGGLPDQLLALLDGSWMKPSPPTDPAIAPALQAAGTAATPSNDASLAAALPAAADRRQALGLGSLALASHIDAVAASAPGLAVTDASSGDGLATATTSDANSPLSSFPAVVPLTANSPAARALMAPPVTVPTDPQTGFDDGFGARLVWMAEQRLGHAEIRLNPEHLGPIEVRVQVDGAQVSAEFHSGHAGVRQAIEASLPRLREMLGQHGLLLGQADVGQRQAGSGQARREGADGHPLTGSSARANSGAITPPLRSRGLIDEYA